MDDPLPPEQCNAHSDHNAAGDQESPMPQGTPNVDFQSAQIFPTSYGNACEHYKTN